jgi:hypothetical protein
MTAVRCAICLVILALLLAATSCSNVDRGVVAHKGFVGLREFSVTSESTGLETYTKGIIYVRENEGENKGYHAEILAWYEVDLKDWAGVQFSIPCGWEVIDVTSNYYSVNHISVWSSPFCDNPEAAQNAQWWQYVWVEGPGNVWVEGPGNGRLVIELNSTSSRVNPWPGVFKVLVGVGSDERDGARIFNPDYQEIEVPLSESIP